MHGSLVSILIITWNRRQALCRSLDSALAQTYAPLEIVLVDNAGTDGSAEMVAERYPQVRLLQTHRNLGCPSARNLGVANCRGSLIYMLDDDGWLHEDAVARAVARAREDDTIAAVLSSLFIVAEERIVTRLPADQQEPGYRGSFAGGGVLLRRQAFLDAGGYPDDFFRQAEEDDLALRWLDRGFVCFHEPSSIMYHEPSPVRANNHLIAFYSLRNTNKTGLRHWPFPWCALRPLVNLGYALWALVRYGDVAMPAQVLGSLLLDLCTLRGNRRPVSRKAFRLYRQLCRHYRTVHPLRDAAVPQTASRG